MNDLIKLINGYKNFRQHYFKSNNDLFEHLVHEGQKPKFLVVACCDSRVDPAIITGAEPGEIFVVRNVANLVPPYDDNPKHHATSAALEFAVRDLEVKHIIVFGHSHCGGIQALLKNKGHGNGASFIDSWMNIAAQARNKITSEYAHEPFALQTNLCGKLSLEISLNNLLTFPWIKEKVNANMLWLHAWNFDLESGAIQQFNTETREFEAL